MATKRPRSSDWEDEEVEILLEVANELQLFKMLDGKKRRHKNVSTYVLLGVAVAMRMCMIGYLIAWQRNYLQ